MAWRLARSLDVLRAEIRAIYPNATIYTIGDPAHAARASDHNPNAEGVVCAIDVMGAGGVDLPWLAEQIRAAEHVAGKYIIFSARIAKASEGWVWRAFGGDPHTDHIHVSVGVGPDGQSTGPYDDTSPWGIGGDMVTDDDIKRIAKGVWGFNAGASQNPMYTLTLLRQAAATSTALLPKLDAILVAAEDDGDTTVVLDAAALAAVREVRDMVAALPTAEETADAVLDAEAARLAD
jgi:hypothetical protein